MMQGIEQATAAYPLKAASEHAGKILSLHAPISV